MARRWRLAACLAAAALWVGALSFPNSEGIFNGTAPGRGKYPVRPRTSSSSSRASAGEGGEREWLADMGLTSMTLALARALPRSGAKLLPRGAGGGRRLGNTLWHGGHVMRGTVTVHLLFYGTWAASDIALVQYFVGNVRNSPWLNIETTYYDGVGPSSADVVLGTTVTTGATRGLTLTSSAVWTLLRDHISAGAFPTSPNAVYMLLTSADVNQADATEAFCTHYCGWHYYSSYGSSQLSIKYAWVGNANRCLSSCAAQSLTSPNGSPGVDAMLSVLAHELVEAMSDPEVSAWYDSTGKENADICAWQFSPTYRAPGTANALANVQIGAKHFLIQQNWVNVLPNGYCAMQYAPQPVGSATPSRSPAAQQSGSGTPAATPSPVCAPPWATVTANGSAVVGALAATDSRALSGCAATLGVPAKAVRVDIGADAPLGGTLVIDTCDARTAFDTVLTVGAGCAGTAAQLGCVAESDDACGTRSRVVVPGVASRYYTAVVHDYYGGSSGVFALTAAYTPPNVSPTATRTPQPLPSPSPTGAPPGCAVAALLLGTSGTSPVLNLTAGSPQFYGSTCSNGYRVQAYPAHALRIDLGAGTPLLGSLTVSTCTSDRGLDTVIYVGGGACPTAAAGSFECYAGNDDSACGTGSRVDLGTVSSRYIHVVVQGYWGATGTYSLAWAYTPPPVADATPTPTPGAAALVRVGSYALGSGPSWSSAPPTYSCVEACAAVYGGAPELYRCSVLAAGPVGTAWVDGYGNPSSCGGGTAANDTFKAGPAYAGPGSFSAWVQDNCPLSVNYCWRAPSPSATPASTPGVTGTGTPTKTPGATTSPSRTPTPSRTPGCPPYVALDGVAGTVAPASTAGSGVPLGLTRGGGCGYIAAGAKARYFRLSLGAGTPLGGSLTVTTCGTTDDDTVLQVGAGCALSDASFACVGAGDDECGDVNGMQSSVTVAPVTAGVFYVAVAGYGGANVSAGLAWTYTPPTQTTTPTPSPTAALPGAYALVGSYTLNAGPYWGTNPRPRTYSCVEACAALYSGSPSAYRCSTGPSSATGLAWVDGFGDESHCPVGSGSPAADDFKAHATYDGVGAFSALVQDHCGGAVNYCWASAPPSPLPTPTCPPYAAASGTSGSLPPFDTSTDDGGVALQRLGALPFMVMGARYRLVRLDLGAGVPTGGVLTVSTCGATGDDTVLLVGAACPSTVAGFQLVAVNDDGCGVASSVSTRLPAGSSVAWVLVGGFAGANVTSGLAWSYAPPSPTATRTPTPSASPVRLGSSQYLAGSYAVSSGPPWDLAPRTYSCVEACAAIFGGAAARYGCSTTPAAMTGTAHTDGYDDESYCAPAAAVADTFRGGVTYGPAAYSAWVSDHDSCAGVLNYCWVKPAPSPTASPACPAAIALSGTSGQTAVYNTRVSSVTLPVTSGCGLLTASGRYKLFTLDLPASAPLRGALTVSTCGVSADDTVLELGTGCPTSDGAFGCLAASDDYCSDLLLAGGGGLTSTVRVANVTSRRYWVVMGGFGGGHVTSALWWRYDPASPSATPSRSRTPSRTRTRTRSKSHSKKVKRA